MIKQENKYTNLTGLFPNAQMTDATGAGLTDGSEFAALPLNDGWEAFQQAVMDYAAGGANVPTGSVGVPNGVADAAGVNQLIQALQLANGAGPGKGVIWFGDDDPSVTGDRVLLLSGQGVLIASYPALDAAVYVGNTANPTVAAGGGAFYRSSDAGGATPNVAGPYLQLPESRGYAMRVLDLAASVDPLGAARFLGDNQVDAGQRITGNMLGDAQSIFWTPGSITGVIDGVYTLSGATSPSSNAGASTVMSEGWTFDSNTSISPNAAKTDDDETRMSNVSIKLGIVY